MNLRQFLRCEMVQKLVCLSMTVMVLSCLLLAPLSAWAAPGDWRWYGLGLNGETVRAVVIDPTNSSILYAGTDTGVYKSSDGGMAWNSIGLANSFIMALAIDPVTHATLYAGTFEGGVYKSTDSGVSWGPVKQISVNAVTAIDFANSATLYAGTWDLGVFKSVNSGGIWTAANTGLTPPFVWSMAIDPVTPATLYVGTLYGGVYKSVDSGANWNAFNSGLPTSLPQILSLAIDPVNPAVLYAGTPLDGVFKSTNSGATWNPVGQSIMDVSRLAIDPISSATLYAGTLGGGISKSSDAGASWESFNATLTSHYVTALAIARTTPSTTIYAGTNDGLFMMFQQPVDTTPPTGGMTINGSTPYTPTNLVTLNLLATDAVGVTGYYLSTSATPPTAGSAGWITVKESRNYQADVLYALEPGNGSRTVNVWYKDAEGNVSTTSNAGVVVDTTVPVDGTLAATAGNSKVYLSWSGFSSAVSGIAGYTVVYATDSEPSSCTAGTQLYTGPATSFLQGNLTNGTPYYYRVCAINRAGNISPGVSASAVPDGTAPSGGISINGGASATSTTLVTLALSAIDNSGVTGYYLSVTPAPPTAAAVGWTPFTATTSYYANLPFTLGSGDAAKTVYVWYKDGADNISPVASSQIILDTIPPVDGILTAISGDGQVSLNWNSFSDVGSGIAGYTVVYDTVGIPLSCNAGTQVYTGGGTSFTQTALANGIPCYYRVCATDNAGNISTGVGVSATPDGTAPVGAIIINDGKSLTSNSTVTLSLSANDDVGVIGYYLSTVTTPPAAGAAGWSAVTSTTVFSVQIPFPLGSGDGAKTVYVWYKDLAGNVSATASYPIILDTTPPIDGVLTVVPGDTQTSLSWDGFSDAGSGIAAYTLVFGIGSVPSCALGTLLYTGTDTSYTHTGLAVGVPYFYRACATDNAGNISLGVKAPVNLTAKISGSGSGTLNSITPGVSFSCSTGSCAAGFTTNTALILHAGPDSSSLFTGWTGDCTGPGDCSLTMSDDRSVIATFGAAPKVKVGVKEFATLQEAYDDLATKNNSTIMLLQGVLPGTFTADKDIVVYLDGGYRADYGAISSVTTLQGPLVVKSGTVVVNAVVVQ